MPKKIDAQTTFDFDKQLDLVIDGREDDVVEVEMQSRSTGQVLYVHLNGMTVARICIFKRGEAR